MLKRRPATLDELARLVDRPVDLSLDQWHTLYDQTVAFRPDLIVELGRGFGNSTTLFVAAAQQIGARVVSVGDNDAFTKVTRPKLCRRLGRRWLRPLTVIQGLIEDTDLSQWLHASQRSLLFWDAHGTELADHILKSLIPAMPEESVVFVHDIGVDPTGTSDLYRYGELVSTFDEIEPLGRWLEEHSIHYTFHPAGMISFATPPP